MKIAIKANSSRGRVIISLLESLGGINSKGLRGDGEVYTYYIDKNNKINYDRAPIGYKVYTLEEFEKEGKFTETCLNGIKQDIVYNPDYWTKLEHQYAGMAMAGIRANPSYDEASYATMADDAIRAAHALVEKMKESK